MVGEKEPRGREAGGDPCGLGGARAKGAMASCSLCSRDGKGAPSPMPWPANTFGSRKVSRLLSSIRSFWRGVPVSIRRPLAVCGGGRGGVRAEA